jgi:branched-chain amino acid transport system permease protein
MKIDVSKLLDWVPKIILIVLFTIPLWVEDPLVLNIFIYTYVHAFYAGSWSISGRYCGQISLGHALYFGLGAYIPFWLCRYYDISPWLGMFGGGIASAFLAFLIGLVCFRLVGLFYIFGTFAFAEVVRIIFLHPIKEVSGGEQGIPFSLGYTSTYHFQFVEKWPYYIIALSMMLIVIYILQKIERSRLGYCFKAISEDEDAAEAIGISKFKYKLIAVSISAFLSALAGTFYVHFLGYVGVNDVFGVMVSILPIMISWIGGGGAFGPVVGAFIITPVSMYLVLMLGGTLSGLHNLIYASILIFIVMFLPEGVTEPLHKRVYLPFKEQVKKLSFNSGI